jgi:hypothetical protein
MVMSKVLVVSYSYTGTCRRLAQLLCAQQNWPAGEITEIVPRSGAAGLWRCLVDSWLRRRPQIHYQGPSVSEFDAVVLIVPIWAYRLASPMRSFVAFYRDRLRHVAVVSVMGGSGGPNAVAEVAELTGHRPIASIGFHSREVEDGSCAQKLAAFATLVEAMEDTNPAVRPPVWSPQAT